MAVIGKINSVENVTASVKYARDGLDKDTKEIKCVVSGGYGIDPDVAEWQIKATARAYSKEKGIEGYSIVTSFKEGKISPERALEVVKETWERVTKEMNGDFPCAFYVHGNTDHVHVHAVAGAVDPQTGVKLHQKRMWELMRDKSDEVCREYGLSVVEEKAEKRQDRIEYHLNKQGTYSWKTELKERIEKAFTPAIQSIEDFKQSLRNLGVELHSRMRKQEPIFMYEFTGKDGKQHKAKDFKLGGMAYERQYLENKINSLSKSNSKQSEKAKELSDFFTSFSAEVENQRQKEAVLRQRQLEARQRRPKINRDRGGISL